MIPRQELLDLMHTLGFRSVYDLITDAERKTELYKQAFLLGRNASCPPKTVYPQSSILFPNKVTLIKAYSNGLKEFCASNRLDLERQLKDVGAKSLEELLKQQNSFLGFVDGISLKKHREYDGPNLILTIRGYIIGYVIGYCREHKERLNARKILID
ncbi:MAG: hypothetical protein PHF67_02640 [Candidatus Nanoarchaeia archaeon]|nr:hypothetical protein [Candidatus Nanoarchaeia archaeon]